ncbi:hypothetical protein TrLO_g1633 [Triparma laevis f. longispina]|uniref:Uncharacterized protein n=1 Tax=Triparma laevis f. longispina TaxID=1714387 RepID=A0A9W7ADH2_9STRA|nr:hypothetical protein TrLO_g1633 [Triparma laevis f. longispina]
MGNNFSHTRIPTDFEDMHKNLGIKFATDWNKNEIYLNLATEVIASIKDIFLAEQQTDRLGKATGTVLLNYRFHDNGHRYREIEKIEDIPAAKQLVLPGKTVEERVEVLLIKTVW